MPIDEQQLEELKRQVGLLLLHDHDISGGEPLKTSILKIKDTDISFSDNATGDVSITAHGFAPKAPNDATKFLDGTGAYDTVKDSDLSTSDITTNNATNTKHGWLLKLIDDTTKFLRSDGTWVAPSGGLTIINSTIANNSDVATSGGAGTNTDTVVTHGLGKTPVKITVSATIKAKGQTNGDGRGSAIAIYASSSSDPILIDGRYTGVDPNGTLNAGSFTYLTGTQPFLVNHGSGDGENIKIQIVSIGATTFTFRINGDLSGVEPGASTVTNISWVAEG